MSFLSKFFEILEGKKRNLVGVESDDDSIDFEEDMCEVGEVHDIDAYITNDNFPSYTIEKNIHPNRFDSSAHPSCMPISYLFSLSGKPVLAVLFMNTNQYRAMIAPIDISGEALRTPPDRMTPLRGGPLIVPH